MKKKILSLALVLCLCLPLLLTACSGGIKTIQSYEMITEDASKLMTGGEIKKLGSPQSKIFEGTIRSFTKEYIIEVVKRTEETDEDTQSFTDTNVYDAQTFEKILTVTSRTDIGALSDEVAEDTIVYADASTFSASLTQEYITTTTKTKGGTYRVELLDKTGKCLISYEGEKFSMFTQKGSGVSLVAGHATIDNKLYRFEKDSEPALVKDLDLTELDEAITEYPPKTSYYRDGKYVFVYEDKVAIYGDKLDKPTFVEMPLEEKSTDMIHNETDTELEITTLQNGNLYLLYTYSKRLICDDCLASCEMFENEKGNYLFIDGEWGYNYSAFVIDIQSKAVKSVNAPDFVVDSITAIDTAMYEMILGANLLSDKVINVVNGYEISEQEESNELVNFIMDNNGAIVYKVENPYDSMMIIPFGEGYIASIDDVEYLLDKDLNIISECPDGENVGLVAYLDGCLYDIYYNLVKELPDNYQLVDTTAELFIFLKTETETDEEGNELEYKYYVLINEKGEEVSKIQKTDVVDIFRTSNDSLILTTMLYDENSQLTGVQFTIYDNKGSEVTTFTQAPPDIYSSVSLKSVECENGKLFIYSTVAENEAPSKSAALFIPYLVEATGE